MIAKPTPTPNFENEKIKRDYFEYLREAKGNSNATVEAVAMSIARFEEFTRSTTFEGFSRRDAVAFKRHLVGQRNSRTGELLSKATIYAVTQRLVQFFKWLRDLLGSKCRFSYADAAYLAASEKDMRTAKARRTRTPPTHEQLLAILKGIPTESAIDLRDRAVIALIALTGVRDMALVSLKMKHLDMENEVLHQDAREVETKFGKSFPTYFFPVDAIFRESLGRWVDCQVNVRLKGPNDALFPATRTKLGESGFFEVDGLADTGWSDAKPVRKIFRSACERVGLPYFNPHSVRNFLVALGQRLCRTPEEYKAWSQNLGHENVLTTFTSYGTVHADRQEQIFQRMKLRSSDATGVPAATDDAAAIELLRKLGARI